MKPLLLALLVIAALPKLAAQTFAWRYESPTPIDVVFPDGTGGCLVWGDAGGNTGTKAVWLTSKGVKKAEVVVPNTWEDGPGLITSTRFYVTLTKDGARYLRKYRVGKGGEVTFTDTLLPQGTQVLLRPPADDKSGFFVFGGNTPGAYVTRYLHGP